MSSITWPIGNALFGILQIFLTAVEVDDVTKLASGLNTLWNKYLNNEGGGGNVKNPCDLMNFPYVSLSTPENYYNVLSQLYYITVEPDDLPHEINIGDYSFTPKYMKWNLAVYPGNIGRFHNDHPDDPIYSYNVIGWTVQMKSHNGEEECPPELYNDPWLADAKGSYHIRVSYVDIN